MAPRGRRSISWSPDLIIILIMVLRARRLLPVGLLILPGLAACGSDAGEEGIQVIATSGIVAELAERVAGGDAEVVQLVPDGASPHDFELSAEDRQTLEQADLIAYNGAGLEAGIPVEEADAPTWALADNARELLPFEEGGEDPHVWMDPTRTAAALDSLAAALGEVDPDAAAAYRERAREYAADLRDLDRELDDTLASVAPGNRELVTSHDSLGYFAERYGFEVLATPFPASGPEAEASPAQLADVIEAIEESDVPAVFAADEDDPEVLTQIAEQTGVEVVAELLVESTGDAGSYEEMLRRDAELISAGLAGG
jgi:zinc/manganese transport system substrate-binding protein